MKFLRIFSLLFCIYLVFCTVSCRNNPAQTGSSANRTAKILKEFPFVKAPAMINSPEEANAYVLEHYWDEFCRISNPVNDSLIVNSVEKGAVEQAVVSYIYGLGNNSDVVERAMVQLGATLDTASFLALVQILDRYLYNPNSPHRNEELYLPVARYMASYPRAAAREAYAKYARLCSLNRIGQKAADFRWCTKTGRTGTLYGISAPYTIVFFSNPGCNDCKRVIDVFTEDKTLTGLIAAKTVAFLNYYTDENLGEWLKYMPIYPESWINAYDPDFEIKDNTKYNLRAIPSIYLLDSGKRVIMKDALPENVIAYLQSI